MDEGEGIRQDAIHELQSRLPLLVSSPPSCIASHRSTQSVSCRPVQDTYESDPEQLIQANDTSTIAYSDWHEDRRIPIDLEDEASIPPYADENGRLIPLYNEKGFPIKRAARMCNVNARPPALLADLSKIGDAFADFDGQLPDGGIRTTKMYAYPQAFTKYGNVQAERPMPVFQTRIRHINRRIRKYNTIQALQCMNFQGYNLESHKTRTSAKTHIAQNAAITQLAGGTHLKKPTARFKQALAKTEFGDLPHTHLQSVIDHSNKEIGSNFRMEVVYILNLDNLRDDIVSGRCVLIIRSSNRVLITNIQRYIRRDHPRVDQPMEPRLRHRTSPPLSSATQARGPSLLHSLSSPTSNPSQIFPEIYNWATYGICALIQRLYDLNKLIIHGGAGHVSPYIVELISMLERAYNFGHTGSCKVIIRSLMDAFWLSLGIKHDGFPCLNARLRAMLSETNLDRIVEMLCNVWPSDPETKEPVCASSKAQIYAYGAAHWAVSLYSLDIRHLTKVLSSIIAVSSASSTR